MMGFRRGRPDRAKPGRWRLGSDLESLESRQLLSAFSRFSYYHPTVLSPAAASTRSALLYFNHPIGEGQRQLSYLDNDGKILTGMDRDGDQWQITVHGPGAVIVTDVTPNDGALDDELDTITIVGSDPERTFVTGQVTASARVITDGTVNFNRLFAENGVNHIVLNGFNLTQTVQPVEGQPNNAGVEVYLPGGVKYLSFNNVEAQIDLAELNEPVDIVIGEATNPLRVAPTINIGSIFNTVFDSSTPESPAGTPPTEPSVNIIVNGQIRGLDIVSATKAPIESAGIEYAFFPNVGTTGRTAVRALGIDGLRSAGSARNFTASRDAIPFNDSFSGLDRLGHAAFGGVTDGLALDVQRGNIGRLTFLRGIGDPTGALSGGQNLGRPVTDWGNAAFGLLGGVIAANRIGQLEAGPANYVFQSVQDPEFAQIERTGTTTFFTRPGRALTNAIVMTSGDARRVTIVGDLQGSEIKTGADYASYLRGLEPVRSPSAISPIRVKGSLIDSVISATYRATNGIYGDINEATGTSDDVAGPGVIRGTLQQGGLFRGSFDTALANQGTGFFARQKLGGYLPPPSQPIRIHGVNVDF